MTRNEYQSDFFEPIFVYVVQETSDEGQQAWVFKDDLHACKFAKREFGKWLDNLHIYREDYDTLVNKSANWDQGRVACMEPVYASIEAEPYPWIRVTKQKILTNML